MTNNSPAGENRPIFSKELSLAIKGVAILMMLAHHCVAFPDYWLDVFLVACIHFSFFLAYTRDVVQPLVSWTNIPVIRYLLVLIFSLAASVLLDKLWNLCALPVKQLRKKSSGK